MQRREALGGAGWGWVSGDRTQVDQHLCTAITAGESALLVRLHERESACVTNWLPLALKPRTFTPAFTNLATRKGWTWAHKPLQLRDGVVSFNFEGIGSQTGSQTIGRQQALRHCRLAKWERAGTVGSWHPSPRHRTRRHPGCRGAGKGRKATRGSKREAAQEVHYPRLARVFGRHGFVSCDPA